MNKSREKGGIRAIRIKAVNIKSDCKIKALTGSGSSADGWKNDVTIARRKKTLKAEWLRDREK